MILNSKYHSYNVFNQRKEECTDYIESLADELIIANSVDDLIENVVCKYQYDIIRVSEEILDRRNLFEKEIDNPYYHLDFGSMLDKIKGIHFQFFHNYTGNIELLEYQATSSIYWIPKNIEVSKGSIIFYYDKPYLDDIEMLKEQIMKDYRDDFKRFKELVGYMNNDIEVFNNDLKIVVKKSIENRKNRLSKLLELSNKMSIPLIKRADAPNYNPISIIKKSKPLSTKIDKEDQYYIPDEDYKEINRIIRHCGSSMERVPKTYNSLNEEQLRNIFVSHINVDYEGIAQGEAFRNKGKTDICIEYNNRAAFVTECKIWNGPKVVKSTIIQLLGYITWKDSKLDIIFINKDNKDFFRTINCLKEELQNVDDFISLKNISKNEFELLINSNNCGQILNIHIFIFNLYVE